MTKNELEIDLIIFSDCETFMTKLDRISEKGIELLYEQVDKLSEDDKRKITVKRLMIYKDLKEKNDFRFLNLTFNKRKMRKR